MQFRRLEFSDKTLFEKYGNPEDINFENDFAVLYCWNGIVDYSICQVENAVIIKLNVGSEIIYDIPITKDTNLDVYIELCHEDAKKNNIDFSMKILKKSYEFLSDKTKEKYNFELNPNAADYIYNACELAGFLGRKFQKKRNLLSQFLRNYKYDFVSFDKAKHYDEILQFQKERALADNHEFNAFKKAIDNLELLNLNCDIIEIDNKIAAFNVSLLSKPNCGEMLFEKANIEYKGCYAAIVKFSASKHFANCQYINRQEDMGLENLRKSKLSYNPIFQIEKYMLTPK
ncbi:MAG: phosphatidylglycerol lysyltransferase domain-containing protein [Elusimicrobiota bacterium]|jgi:hypothetical protein|nr:phosphatidylglycerol lysyltransferase domain-containing protein [Elusimicrobiota bacterium]